jgi:uncharacterized Zn finger protein
MQLGALIQVPCEECGQTYLTPSEVLLLSASILYCCPSCERVQDVAIDVSTRILLKSSGVPDRGCSPDGPE